MTATVGPMRASASISTRSFRVGLCAIAVLGLAIRIGAAFWYDRYTVIGGDAVWYFGVGNLLADGWGFLSPLAMTGFHKSYPSAAHPPVYALYLSIVSQVDGSILAQRLWSCLPGVGTVVFLGLLTRDLAGERAGLIAAALGAVFVDLVAQDVILMSEGMFAFTIVLTVFLSYRFLRQPDLLRAGLLGGAIALAALTRAEGALLFLILLVPLALRSRELAMARRVGCIAVGAVVALALVAPWLVYNAGRFENPVYLSTGLGGLVASSNCPQTYRGGLIGAWGGICAKGVVVTVLEDETVQDQKLLDAGLEYARDHADRLPVVIPVRLLRSFGFYQPVRMTGGDLVLERGNGRIFAWVAVFQYWVLLGLGVVGMVMLHRRRVAVLPFVAPIVTVVAITVIGYGTMRFRVALDVVLPALAAIALDAAWSGWRVRHRPDASPAGSGAGERERLEATSSSAGAGTVALDS